MRECRSFGQAQADARAWTMQESADGSVRCACANVADTQVCRCVNTRVSPMPHAEMRRCKKIADVWMPFPPGGDGPPEGAARAPQGCRIWPQRHRPWTASHRRGRHHPNSRKAVYGRARSRRGLAEKCRCASGRVHVTAGATKTRRATEGSAGVTRRRRAAAVRAAPAKPALRRR